MLTNTIKILSIITLISVSGLLAQTQWKITWDPNTEPNIKEYKVFKGQSPGASTLITTIEHPTTEYTDTDIVKGQIYYYRLKAVDDTLSESNYSTEVSESIPLINFPGTQVTISTGINNLNLGQYVTEPDGDNLYWYHISNNAGFNVITNGQFATISYQSAVEGDLIFKVYDAQDTSAAFSDMGTISVIIDTTGASQAPTAEFSATPLSGEAPLTVQFTDQSTPGGNPINSWAWDFGDGTNSTQQNPQHIYSLAGSYTVSLTATDNASNAGVEIKIDYITVNSVQPPDPPMADFSATPRKGEFPLTVNFTDKSTKGSGTINSRSWDFGDEQTGSGEEVAHTYTEPGKYDVTLIVRDNFGVRDTVTKNNYIDVSAPKVKAYPVPIRISDGGHITFDNIPDNAKLLIYNVLGELVFKKKDLGNSYNWTLVNDSDKSIAPGIYLYYIKGGGSDTSGKLVIKD